MRLITLLQIAGLAHVGFLVAGLSMPQVVRMNEHTRALPPFLRQLFYVYYFFIGFCILGFGALTFFFADQIATGQPLARAFAGFLAAFWLIRLVAGLFVFDLKPYLTNWAFKFGYHLLNLGFLFILAVYLWALLCPDLPSS